MLVALHKNERVCSLDTKNIYGNYEYDIIETLKKASQRHELICEECGGEVFLKAGDFKVPHFAHKSISKDCYFNDKSVKESEEHRKGKLALYKYLKQKFHNSLVEVDYRLSNNRRANIYIETPDKKFAFEYLRNDMNLNLWEKKHIDFKEIGATDYWILSAKDFRKGYKENLDFFKKFIEKNENDQIIKLFDTDSNEIFLMKYLEYRDEKNKLVRFKSFSKSYNLNTLDLDIKKGLFITDFMEKYEIAKEKFCREWEKKLKQNRDEQKINKQISDLYRPVEVLVNKEIKSNRNNSSYNVIYTKSQEELKEEALEYKKNNPQGPWYDSTKSVKWGVCEECGMFTNEWRFFDGKSNTCLCYKCS